MLDGIYYLSTSSREFTRPKSHVFGAYQTSNMFAATLPCQFAQDISCSFAYLASERHLNRIDP
jgi:hypothetical protein